MNNIYDLLTSSLFSNILKNTDVQEHTIDLTSDEGHKLAIDTLDAALSNSFTKSFFGEEVLTNLRDAVETIYTNENVNENNNKEEIDNELTKPSEKCTDKQKEQITELVNEYVDNIIQPNGNFKPEVVKSVKNSLFEFACWIMTK